VQLDLRRLLLEAEVEGPAPGMIADPVAKPVKDPDLDPADAGSPPPPLMLLCRRCLKSNL